MLHHRFTNGGALAFQGATIKEGKKSCSQRGEIHFVPGFNICCSRPSQKDARIKPKSPLIYCNDRQTERQAERMTICGSEGEKGKDKNNFCLTVCHFLSAKEKRGDDVIKLSRCITSVADPMMSPVVSTWLLSPREPFHVR
ncbi:hypothetical protein KUCAC02_025310 [Chaenocephalus aceratus]|uniref:Uncharacterized protein n=1 Tax=Chaenocephalus aceratus TaxID=36190 RepID=A0ACB9VTN4_CHAAC|nr:hypothetical protein KUCAC02_025310 [Chaenocephalus aceratus]